ncbi:hypothetical protein [Paracoccus sp. KR1-242]|uniref:hypothetical protein n=1 Tax=Paracoccus sp. KR1-242 TaxID=3410028 RepID=UPI003C12887C
MMMTLFYLAFVALTVAALLWWAIREPGARLLAALLMALMVVPLPVFAGAVDEFMAAASPHLNQVIGLALTAIIGVVAKVASKKWGIEIEANQREALHWALSTGAQLALKHELTGRAAIDLIITYAKRSVPDAIGGLKPSAEVLTDLAQAKLEQAAAEKLKNLTTVGVDQLADALKRAAGS